jgi:hypothetical protein
VQPVQGRRQRLGETQKPSELHRRSQKATQRPGARVVEDQHGAAALAYQIQRPNRPRGVEVISQAVLVGEAIERRRCWRLRCREYDQDILASTACFLAPRPAEDKPAFLRQDFEATNSARAEPRRQPHSQASPLSQSTLDPSAAPRLALPHVFAHGLISPRPASRRENDRKARPACRQRHSRSSRGIGEATKPQGVSHSYLGMTGSIDAAGFDHRKRFSASPSLAARSSSRRALR